MYSITLLRNKTLSYIMVIGIMTIKTRQPHRTEIIAYACLLILNRMGGDTCVPMRSVHNISVGIQAAACCSRKLRQQGFP